MARPSAPGGRPSLRLKKGRMTQMERQTSGKHKGNANRSGRVLKSRFFFWGPEEGTGVCLSAGAAATLHQKPGA